MAKTDPSAPTLSPIRIAIGALMILVALGLMVLPSPLVRDAGRQLSGLGAWQMQRKIVDSVEAGGPCLAIAVGYSEPAAEAVIRDEMPTWQDTCTELGAQNETPIIIRISHKSGGVDIDVAGAQAAGFEFDPATINAVEDEAWTELGIEHYDATAWLALSGLVDDQVPAAIPAYMPARGRPLRSALSGLTSMLLFVLAAVVIALSKPGALRDRPWFDGSVPSSTTPAASPTYSPPPAAPRPPMLDDE